VNKKPKLTPKSSEFREGIAVHFRGSVAVHKLLASAGMHATKVEMYKGALGSTWVADTDKGNRWVSHGEGGWKISKAPPAPMVG
jgi:hypothetical protein